MWPPVVRAVGEEDLAAHHPEAVRAIDRTRAGRSERNLRLVAAARADGVVHLARATRVPTAVAAAVAVAAGAGAAARGASLGATRGAALRSGREALLREELLLGCGKDEIDSAVAAGDHLIGVGHEDPSQL